MPTTPAAGVFLDTDRITSALGLVQGMHAVDLGCGSGYFVASMARAVGKEGIVYAVDIRDEPLLLVQTRAEALGLANIRTVKADAEVLGGSAIPGNSLDVVLISTTLVQSQKKDAMLQEGVRMLKSGGRLVVIDWKKGVPGFGPPDELRISEDDVKRLAEGQGVKFQRPLDTGRFYYGLVFIKP